MNRKKLFLAVLLVVLMSGCLTLLFRMLLTRTDVGRVLTTGAHVAYHDCPRCGQRMGLDVGQEQPCRSCGERLATCGYCGTLLAGASLVHRDRSGKQWLCAEHHAQEAREAAQLQELASPEANAPVLETPRAVAARTQVESKVREVIGKGGYVTETLFPHGSELSEAARSRIPPAVAESYAFYKRSVMDQDFGSVRAFRWDLDGSPIYLVRCTTDGSDGWLELFDGDGTPLGYARTEADQPTWLPKGQARKSALTGDR